MPTKKPAKDTPAAEGRQLSPQERPGLFAAVERIGLRRVAHEVGVSATAVASAMAGRGSRGTVATIRAALPRLAAELAPAPEALRS